MENVSSLSFNVFRALSNSTQDNIVFSPLSLSCALLVLFFGSGGKTSVELTDALFGSRRGRVNNFSPDHIRKLLESINNQNGTKISNALFLDDSISLKNDFRTISEQLFKTRVEPIDFSEGSSKAVAQVNQRMKEMSDGSFAKIIDFVTPATKMIFINALTFKNEWKYTFDKRRTKKRTFMGEDGRNFSTDMMSMSANLESGASESLNVMAVKLPFRGGRSSMIILLPRPDFKIHKVLENLSLAKLKIFLASDMMQKSKTRVVLPKFSMEWSQSLVDPLRAFGIRKIFDASRSNFTGMTNDASGLFIGDFFQKVKMQVDEVGSKASVATAAVFKQRSLSLSEDFIVNRPFLFLIATFDQKVMSDVLFLGLYTSPPFN